ncbi:hypothetical protein OC842_007818, partial [Tilletia horrida]
SLCSEPKKERTQAYLSPGGDTQCIKRQKIRAEIAHGPDLRVFTYNLVWKAALRRVR